MKLYILEKSVLGRSLEVRTRIHQNSKIWDRGKAADETSVSNSRMFREVDLGDVILRKDLCRNKQATEDARMTSWGGRKQQMKLRE